MATLVTPTDKAEKVEKKSPPVTDEKPERRPRPRMDEKFKIFSRTANEPLADEVCHFLGMQRGQAQVIRFTGAGGSLPEAGAAEFDGGLAGCGRRGAGAIFREES